MRLIYIFGPFSDISHWSTHVNVVSAEIQGAKLAMRCNNAMPVIPHCNTENMVGIQDSHYWIEGTLELMRRCDALLAVSCSSERLKQSIGSQGEIAEATRLGIPIFYTLDEACAWLNKLEDEENGQSNPVTSMP